MSDAQREYKKRNLELGLCQDCPGPRSSSSKNFCESCLEKNRARARAYAQKKRNFKEWIHSDAPVHSDEKNDCRTDEKRSSNV